MYTVTLFRLDGFFKLYKDALVDAMEVFEDPELWTDGKTISVLLSGPETWEVKWRPT